MPSRSNIATSNFDKLFYSENVGPTISCKVLPLEMLTITYVTIVVGELVPKRIGQLNPEKIACMVLECVTSQSAVLKCAQSTSESQITRSFQ